MAATDLALTIRPLAEVPQHVEAAAAWVFSEWSHRRLPSAAAQAELWRRDIELSGLPRHFVALVEQVPVGAASLVGRDLASRPELTPWLANVVVDPPWRRRGIATALVRTVEAAAAEAGYARLYLHTSTAARLYARLGWQRYEETRDGGERVLIMSKPLAGPGA